MRRVTLKHHEVEEILSFSNRVHEVLIYSIDGVMEGRNSLQVLISSMQTHQWVFRLNAVL